MMRCWGEQFETVGINAEQLDAISPICEAAHRLIASELQWTDLHALERCLTQLNEAKQSALRAYSPTGEVSSAFTRRI